MTTDDILSMAREQGLPETETEGVFRVNADDLGRILAAEREECAKVCKNEMMDEAQCNDDVAYNAGCYDCAAAIRARGKT